MGLVVAVVAVVALLATYVTWLAGRVDRLTVRCDAARSALDAQLLRRALAAGALADTKPMRRARDPDDATAAELGESARLALAAPEDAREPAESALSRAVRAVLPPEGLPVAPQPQPLPLPLPRQGAGTDGRAQSQDRRVPEAVVALEVSAAKVALARQFHNDAVRDLRALRGRRLVRLLGLGGRAPLPAYFDIDDAYREPVPRPAAASDPGLLAVAPTAVPTGDDGGAGDAGERAGAT